MRHVPALVPAAAVAVGCLAVACSDSTGPTATRPVAPTARPFVGSVAVVPDSTDALAAFVAFATHDADSARVLYRVDSGAERATAVVAVHDSAQVLILGLPAEATITARVVAITAGQADTSAAVTSVLAAVPDVVRRVRLQTTTGHASTGYLLTTVSLGDTAFVVAFGETGRVAWYRAFPGVPTATDAYQQPNGDITVFLGVPNGYFAEVRPTGEVVREWQAPAGYATDLHELRVGAARAPSYFFGYDYRPTDLTARGGSADSLVSGHTIFRVDAGGAIAPLFAARDHFTAADWVDPEPGLGDFDHPNSIDVDADGDLIVSWRNLDEVSKIDPNTGQFVWRLGGAHNQFTFVNDPLGGFGGQHFARLLPNGDLLLYDNGTTHVPQETRAVEYRLDVAAHTATLVWEFRHQPAVFTPFVGSAQRLANGRTFVGYGGNGAATEVTPDGAVAWEGTLTVDGATRPAYRLLKIAALGRYAAP